MLISPRTINALTAEPGSIGSGCFSFVTEPAPITGTMPDGGEILGEEPHGVFAETGEDQRRIDRLK